MSSSSTPISPTSTYPFDPLYEFNTGFEYDPYISFPLNETIQNEIKIMKGALNDKKFQQHLSAQANIIAREMKQIQFSVLKGNKYCRFKKCLNSC